MNDWGPFSLAGKTALVTGVTGGIGQGIALQMQKAGANVITLARNPSARETLPREVPGIGVVIGDLGAPDGHDAFIAEAERIHGAVDILVNNAALFPARSFLKMDRHYMDELYAVNLRGLALLSQAFAAACIRRNAKGKIVNISSIESLQTMVPEGLAFYGATKGAVNSLTASLGRELGPKGIHVNCIAPGMIVHERLMQQVVNSGMTAAELEASASGMLSLSHVGRLGVPDDIANAVIFFASAASDFISGHTLVVDGGVTLS